MDEYNHNLQPENPPAAETAREVVLRYDAPEPEPVTERYVHPDPLPGRAGSPVPARQTAAPRHGHRGLRIFLVFMALLLVSTAVSFLRGEAEKKKRHTGMPRFEYYAKDQAHGGEETTITRYPNGGGVRLRFSETRGGVLTIQQVYERVNPCTVTIATALSGTSASVGTGVIFTEDGYILTNAHVIQGGTEAFVVLTDGRVFRDVRLVGYDPANDLAVIKVDAEGLPVAEFGDSDALRVGDTVYAIGNPLGIELRGTLTDGIVSAINRNVEVGGVTMTLIQTNAALNNGNSGGPLINVYGQVVGVNTMKMGSQSSVSVEGLGFAIPISSTAWMVDDLIAYGEVRGEPVLGIIVEAGKLSTGESAIFVREVTEGGACGESGVLEGDAIVRADGEALETTDDLLRIRRRYRAGEALALEIDRGGERMSFEVTLREATDQ